MHTTQQRSEHRGIGRPRKLVAIVLMLVAIPLLASCGGGGEQGSGGGGGNGGGGNGGGGGNAGDGGNADGGEGTGASNNPPISDLRVIIASPDKKALNGNRARLTGMEVRRVVSERAFFVGENEAEQLLVLNVGDAVKVSEGQKVLVAGRMNTPSPQLEERFSLSPEEVSAMEDQETLLRAPRVVPQEG